MTTITVINTMPSTATEVKSFVADAKSRILSGVENPIKIAMQLKAMEEVIDNLRKDKDIRELTLREAEKYGKTFKEFGAEFQVKETGVKYDYSVCNDSTLNELSTQAEELSKKIKERETFLKCLKLDIEAIDTKTGEYLNAPSKSSTTSVTVKLL